MVDKEEANDMEKYRDRMIQVAVPIGHRLEVQVYKNGKIHSHWWDCSENQLVNVVIFSKPEK